jgi:hypothetical protein
MKFIISALAVGSFVSGLISAKFWFFSAIEQPPPTGMISTLMSQSGGRETPLDAWIRKVGHQNRLAAGWSAVAVVLGALATLLGTWALP